MDGGSQHCLDDLRRRLVFAFGNRGGEFSDEPISPGEGGAGLPCAGCGEP